MHVIPCFAKQQRHSIAFGSHYFTCLCTSVPAPEVMCQRPLGSCSLARHSFRHNQSFSPRLRPWKTTLTTRLSTTSTRATCLKLQSMPLSSSTRLSRHRALRPLQHRQTHLLASALNGPYPRSSTQGPFFQFLRQTLPRICRRLQGTQTWQPDRAINLRLLSSALRHRAPARAAAPTKSLFSDHFKDTLGTNWQFSYDIGHIKAIKNRHDRRWDRSGRVNAILPINLYHISLNGSRCIAKRMRPHLKPISILPIQAGAADQNL